MVFPLLIRGPCNLYIIFSAFGLVIFSPLKKGSVTNPDKYTVHNLLYAMDFVSWVRQQDPSRLKYLDESHFENWGNLYVHLFAQNCMHVCFADCSRWQFCRGPRGQRVTRTRHMSEAARTSFSVTYMTSLTHPRGGVLLSIREGSNDAIDYFESLVDACHNNHLREGDILVVDNAKIHGAANNNNNNK